MHIALNAEDDQRNEVVASFNATLGILPNTPQVTSRHQPPRIKQMTILFKAARILFNRSRISTAIRTARAIPRADVSAPLTCVSLAEDLVQPSGTK
ncbi:hypothetical protein O7626_30655 [Micromonospora sp. WMMD1102]|uniref:hypothetical protein n=1 Tax=Micromonospora sp. WMMD1102 TaxID=3016105 RepID=UPI0024153606|nr:hypothetical protein [Micromonospora sp. WMMD1102]MDG4790233.1 hypothetical protein [Micromonospora sp. WMMD1102]